MPGQVVAKHVATEKKQKAEIDLYEQKVKNERQRLKLVKNEIEQELNKDFSTRTLKRFLKNLMPDGKG